MNKTVTINISGQIFHIEEPAYADLKAYDAAIRKHFGTTKDASEIISDIENRIAELFNDELAANHRKIIYQADVTKIIDRLGTVSDFATDQDQDETETSSNETSSHSNSTSESCYREKKNKMIAGVCSGLSQYLKVDISIVRLVTILLLFVYGSGLIMYIILWIILPTSPSGLNYTRKGSLYRNSSDKKIGGVCAGLADFIKIDVLWIRLFFILLSIPTFVHIEQRNVGINDLPILFIYCVLWLLLPDNKIKSDLPSSAKKLFRSTDTNIIGGVCAGLGYYSQIDPIIVRLLFVFLAIPLSFFAIGHSALVGFPIFVIYCILWILTPPALSSDEKMEMMGIPVTLDDIVRNQKNNGTSYSAKNTSLMYAVKIILKITSKISGFILFLLGLTFLVLISLAVCIFLQYEDILTNQYLPYQGSVLILLTVAIAIPVLSFIFIGKCLMTQFKKINKYLILSILCIWITCTVSSVLMLINYAVQFKKEGQSTEIVNLGKVGATYNIGQLDTTAVDHYFMGKRVSLISQRHVNIEIRKDNDTTDAWVEIIKIAQGRDEHNAKNNSKLIKYAYVQSDSTFLLNKYVYFDPNYAWRAQKVRLIFHLPSTTQVNVSNDIFYYIN